MEYKSEISWKRNDGTFSKTAYDRTHKINFGSGTSIEASSAPEFAGNPKLPNPEELFVSAISSCFMLTFLYWAANKGLVVNEYTDHAIGKLAKNADGKMAVTEVTLQPKVVFQDNANADAAVLNELYKKAHDNCFISSSVKTKVNVGAG